MSAIRATYHHGNLRTTLLDAALDVLERDGIAALGLRDLARRAGVSHAAPYAHFADKRALLVALAEIGYARLSESLDAALAAAGDDPFERFAAMAEAYVTFGSKNGALYRVMFESPELVGYGEAPTLEAAGEAAYERLTKALASMRSVASDADDMLDARDEGDALAFSAWALLHGIVTLAASGRAPFEPSDSAALATAARTAAAILCRAGSSPVSS